MEKDQPIQLTLEEGRRALGVHALEKGYQLRQKYGKMIDLDVLKRILKDDEFVRYSVELVFDSTKVDPGYFAVTARKGAEASDGYTIYVHEFFRQRPGDVPALVLYHLVTVNYGDFVSCHEAEEFASAALGMEKEEYYQTLCYLTDLIPKTI